MILGIFIRNYKSYRATHFIPINSPDNKLSVFIGINGVGKSAVLDAIDKYFNGGDWSVNSQARAEGGLGSDDKIPFICPVFYLPKITVKSSIAKKASFVDMAIRKTIDTLGSSSHSAIQDFYDFYYANVKDRRDGYLVVLGKCHLGDKRIFLGPFESNQKLRQELGLQEGSYFTEQLTDLQEYVSRHYSYFYIPVEVDTPAYTKLEQRQIQRLLDDDIYKEVSSAIGGSTVSSINSNLRKYLDDIHGHLDGYTYKAIYRENITIKDLTERVFESFFSAKVLHKQVMGASIPVVSLSSGEKRRALIDTIYSLLKRRKSRKSQIIIAIDEPDASLHASACHDQFEKISSLGALVEPAAQIILTTHWYGFLPLAKMGEAQSITIDDDKVSTATINLSSYRESVKEKISRTKGDVPADVAVKGYNDLVQSIFSSLIRVDPYNWVICEGYSDKLYLEEFLSCYEINRLRVLPVGGCVDVMKIYERLGIPMSDPEFKNEVKGVVVCLVDTDKRMPEFKQVHAKSLHFKRIIFNNNNLDVEIVDAWDRMRAPETFIEAALEPAIFYSALQELANSSQSNSDVASRLLKAGVRREAKVSFDVLDTKKSEDALLQELFNSGEKKVDFAKRYCNIGSAQDLPEWVAALARLLGGRKLK